MDMRLTAKLDVRGSANAFEAMVLYIYSGSFNEMPCNDYGHEISGHIGRKHDVHQDFIMDRFEKRITQ